MQLLSRYLLLQFTRYFFTINLAFVAVYLIIDFFEKYDNFTDTGKPMGLVLKFFIFNIPFIIDQLGPVMILLSGVITLGILNHSNEMLALKAAGIPLKRIVQPILIAALLFTSLFIGAAQLMLPKTMAIANDIWYVQVRGKVSLGIFRNGRYYFKGKEGFYSFEWPNSKQMVFRNFSYSTWDDNYNVASIMVARDAKWKPPQWIFTRGQVQTRNADGSFSSELFRIQAFQLPEIPEDFLIPEYESAEQSLTELFFDIGKKEIEADKVKARASFYGRISYLLLGIPLVLLGLPILILSYQKWGKDLSIAIPVSCGMAFFAWGIWGAMQSLATAGYIHAVPASFFVHLIFSILGIYLLKKQDS